MDDNWKHAIIINADGYKVDFAIVDFVIQNEETKEIPYSHTMQEGESLVYEDISTALSMIAPKWNGELWIETGLVEITAEIIEQLRQSKLQEISTTCQSVIYAGVDVETSLGVKHFSLTEPDQLNLTGMASQLEKALLGQPSNVDINKGVAYHADGELCRFWSPEDFAKIAYTATEYVFYNQTYCNHLRQYIKGISDYEELKAVCYGMELPTELQASMANLLGGEINE